MSEKVTQMWIASLIGECPMVEVLILRIAFLCRPIVRLVALAVGDIAHVAHTLSGAAIPIARTGWQRRGLPGLEAVLRHPESPLRVIVLQRST